MEKKKKSKQGHVGDLEVRGIFESSFQEFLPPNFLSILMRKLFGRPRKRIPAPQRMCLFESETGWMENFGKKIGRKTFLECVWLDKKKEK